MMNVDALEEGRAHLARGEWRAAHAILRDVSADDPSAEVLEALGWAAYGLDDAESCIGSRERAFALYQNAGRPADAVRVAAWLASDVLEFRGEAAVAHGWLARANRLLEDVGPEDPARGWLAIHEANHVLAVKGDAQEAMRLAVEAAMIGRTNGISDLEMVGLAIEGFALVISGDVEGGMLRLDESATLCVSAQPHHQISPGWALCCLIAACESTRDFERAAEWCRHANAYASRYDVSITVGLCRAKYASVLMWRGAWREADEQLASALEVLEGSRPALAADAVPRLAELRRRQGDVEEALRLLADVEGLPEVYLIQAAIALERGDPAAAGDCADRFLRQAGRDNVLERARAFELLARIEAARGRPGPSRDAADSLRTIAESAGTTLLDAAAYVADGFASFALDDFDRARRAFEDAVDLYVRSEIPFEEADARLQLARALWRLDRPTAARRECEAALQTFRRLGASSRISEADALLRAGLPAARAAGASLTPREVEVLGFLADGLTNQAIAERLVLSEHTVHRHVTNILRKLKVSSRAAAAAHAVRQGLRA